MRRVLLQAAAMLLCAAMLFCGGCGESTESAEQSDSTDAAEAVTKDVFAMDTYMTLTAYGDGASDAVDQAVDYIETLDAMLSTGSADSEISKLNETGSAVLSSEAAGLFARALEIAEATDGAFHPLLYPIMEAWGFPTQEYRVPDAAELESLLQLTDLDDVTLDADSGLVTFSKAGMKADLGGIANGYTSSLIMEIFQSCGVTSGMVSLGGNVQVLGAKTDGSDWRVALQNPDGTENYLGVLEVQDRAVITSGGYERYFEQDGTTYHHIIDAKTGYPAESGLQSVTIVSEDGTLADGLSTALFVMGLDTAKAYWQANSSTFDAIFLTDDDMLYVTAGLKDCFTSSDYEWIVIEEAQ